MKEIILSSSFCVMFLRGRNNLLQVNMYVFLDNFRLIKHSTKGLIHTTEGKKKHNRTLLANVTTGIVR